MIVATSLLTRSFQATQAVALGFRPDHVLTAQIYLSSNRYALGPAVGPGATAANRAQINSFFDTLLDRARQLPGVTAVAVNNAPPFFGFGADPFFGPDDFGLAISTLAVSGLLACLLPGLRAMRTNPITALRE